jgi:maltokinase
VIPAIPQSAHPDLHEYVGRARWFGGKGREFTVVGVRRIGVLPGSSSMVVPGRDQVSATIELVEVAFADGDTDLYQLPLAWYAEPQDRLEHALVGRWEGPVSAYDAVHDREAMALWLHAFAGKTDPAEPLLFHRLEGYELDVSVHSSPFSGEQSNSSVAFGEDSLMKVFRRITPGVNPDVQVHEALTRAGSDHVAALYGWLDVVDDETDSVVQLAMLQQFLRTASDGFELAKASVRNLLIEADLHPHEVGGDFAGEAERLGVALAETHATMAAEFGVEEWPAERVTALADAMEARLEAAAAVVPELTSYAVPLRAAYGRLRDLGSVTVQRIHGDLHLGQTLRTVKGWKIVDFEGEPAKPLAERLTPDPVWRDIAGMLRSFDYAAAVVERTVMETDTEGAQQRTFRGHQWSERNRDAFLRAYAARELSETEHTVVAAYEADKAVYETVYEVRNRPTWLDIPLAGIARLTAR